VKYENIVRENHGTGHIAEFVHELCFGERGSFGPAFALGFLDKFGMLEAGVVLHDFHPEFGRIELSAASIHRTWMTVSRLNVIADHVFHQLGCWTLVARHDPSNVTAHRLWKALGATEHILPDLRGPGLDDCMHILTLDQARMSKFWRMSDGRQSS
jgi:hypothetical protein